MTDIKTSKIIQINISEIPSIVASLDTDQIIVYVDAKIYSLYPDLLKAISKIEKATIVEGLDGELNKSYSNFEKYCEKILKIGIHRNTHLIAIGGGATSDFVGFLASTLLRGIEWSVLPTTLLAMIDASIGGKTAINSLQGKNLIGSFHKPENVVICKNFLETLPDEQLTSGYGELLKYGFLSTKIRDAILNKTDISQIITLCGEYKERLTVQDFKEKGPRKNLNVGHTIGHALEKKYKIEHGVAVFYGLEIELELLEKNTSAINLFEQLRSSLGFNLDKNPVQENDLDVILDLCFKDKKMTSKSKLELLIPVECENIKSVTVTKKELKTILLKYFKLKNS